MYKDKIVIFSEYEKERTLERAMIDEGIKELSNAINSIPCLMTMNSCEGKIFGDETHCPRTYVDFYVIGDNYKVADNLMILLSSELLDDFKIYEVGLSVKYEQDYVNRMNSIGEYVEEYTNLVRRRYQISFVDARYVALNEEIKSCIRDRVKKATELIIKYRDTILSKDK